MSPAPPFIKDLRTSANPSNEGSFSLKLALQTSLADGQPFVSPGDAAYKYNRSISTLSLYSAKGLDIYEEITACPDYYPFPIELELLRQYGDEIATRMFGLPSQILTQDWLEENDGPHHENGNEDEHFPPNGLNGFHKEKWGDAVVGKNNNGVNGSLGPRSGVAVELGSGSLEKTRYLLRSLSKLLQKSKNGASAPLDQIEYKALDLDRSSLVTTLTKLVTQESEHVTASSDTSNRVIASGIVATYEEGLASLDSSSQSDAKKCLMWLGSSIGNYSRDEAVDFLKNITEGSLMSGDTMLIGIDNCDDKERIERAYDDPAGITRRFILEGVDFAGRELHGEIGGDGGLAAKNFDYVSRWNASVGRHEAYVRCKVDNLKIPLSADTSVTLKKDEYVHFRITSFTLLLILKPGLTRLLAIEVSYKYTQLEARSVFKESGLRVIQQWTDKDNTHTLYLVEKPTVSFPLIKAPSATATESPYGLPSIEDWEGLWKAWDMVTLDILPRSLLMTKPIPLRHICLFYLGHIPAFRDIFLSRALSEELTSPAHFAGIFERGIDPDVADPTKINHSHSIVPENEDGWPKVDEVLAYEEKVRERVRNVYKERGSGGKIEWTRRLARVMVLVFEHEAMHKETLIYIALQASNSLNPAPALQVPDFPSLSRHWDRTVTSFGKKLNAVITVPSQTVVLGHDDPESADLDLLLDPKHEFGWDIESPRNEVQVKEFKIAATPVTNLQYLQFLQSYGQAKGDKDLVPASWSVGKECTFEKEKLKVKSLYGDVEFEFAKHWPLAGSAYQLEAYAKSQGGRLPTRAEMLAFFESNPVDSPNGNLGFDNLHPVPATPPLVQRDGKVGHGSDGGVWMWTSDVLEAPAGYEASVLYPGYSSDFFDGKHQIIVGASYATPPRLARKSFTNWYQGAYVYVVAGARVAFD